MKTGIGGVGNISFHFHARMNESLEEPVPHIHIFFMNRLTSTNYPGGNVATQTYTPRGQIAGIGLDGGTVASYEYNPVGATTAKNIEPLLVGTSGEDCRRQPAGQHERERRSQNGLTALYRYDAAQRLIGLEHRRGLDLLAKIDYTLDKVGNRQRGRALIIDMISFTRRRFRI